MKVRQFILLLIIPQLIHCQVVLDEYVRYGLENNLTLRQRQNDYEMSIELLREARGLFYPNISFNARYTVSEGGRVIEFPVGDLLNPVYSTLNSLTASGLFPVIENQQVRFLRPREHETKIRLAQPVFSPDIYYNSRIKKEMVRIEAMDIDQYKRELTGEIKKAYYNASATESLLKMLRDSRKLLLENIRINYKLLENNKVTYDAIFRSEAELNKFDQDLQNAEKEQKLARAYFNFLLNKALDDSIIIIQPVTLPVITDLTENYSISALKNREELKKFDNYSQISGLQVKMNESGRFPDLFVVADYGFQGEQYRFNRDNDYVQASAVLTWTLFEGFSNRARISQANLQKEMVDNQLEEAKKQIELQVTSALEELWSAEKGIASAESRLKNARESFRIVERKYSEGMASLIEFIDARTTLTRAEENIIISRYRYLSAFSEFEKVAALNKNE